MADTLIILLPGALMKPQEYIDAGFPAVLAASHPDCELQLASLDVDQLNVASLVTTLHHDVILPARQRGHRRLLLGGISLGGAVALHYARQHGDLIDGLCLLAPYPGNRLTTGAIRAAGGPAVWQPSGTQQDDAEFQLWHWLQQGHGQLPLYLGYGSDDRFADGISLMASILPSARVHAVPGGHDWTAWRALWQDFLANGLRSMIAHSACTNPVRPEPVEGRDTERQASTSSARTDGEG